jgi:hypothetical protein
MQLTSSAESGNRVYLFGDQLMYLLTFHGPIVVISKNKVTKQNL